MKIKFVLVAVAMLFGAPTLMAAQAQVTPYVTGGYTQFDTNNSTSPNLGGITARVGVGFGKNWGIEAEGSFGVRKDHGVRLQSEIGIFALAKLPISDSFDIFARVGDARIKSSPNTANSDGAAYGVGAEYHFTPLDGIRGDFTRYDGDNVNALSISYTRRF